MVEHLLHTFVEVLDVRVGLTGESVARRSSPNEGFGFGVKHVDDQGADLVVLNRCCGVSESTTPPPAAAESVVESVERLLVSSHLDRHDGDVASGWHLRPSFGGQVRIDRLLDAVDP